MDTKQLDDALTRLFVADGERIVFWHAGGTPALFESLGG